MTLHGHTDTQTRQETKIEKQATPYACALSGRSRARSLPYMTTHSNLVARQKAAISEKRAQKTGLASDAAWTGDGFVKESQEMVSNS